MLGVLMADPPSAAAAAPSPRALVQESPPNTTACRRRVHGRGRWTTAAVVFRDPDRTGTIARGYLSRNGGACRADEGPDRRICLADRSAETTHRRSDECLPHPNDCPSWRRINRRTPLALPNVADVCRCSLQAPCRSRHAKPPTEPSQTCAPEPPPRPPPTRHP